MKRFSITLLALAFAVVFAVPALAIHEGSLDTGPPPEGMEEGFALYGTYTLDMESYSPQGAGDSDVEWYDDDFEFVIMVQQGPLTATVDLEVSDDESFDKKAAKSFGINRPGDLVDNYFIVYDAEKRAPGLSFKVGEYGVSWGNKATVYSEGGKQIGIKYGFDSADLALYISKVEEGDKDVDDDHDVAIATIGIAKAIDFFSKLDFIFIQGTNDAAVASTISTGPYDYGFVGVTTAFDLGPVPVTFETGTINDDRDPALATSVLPGGNDGGTYIAATAGLDEFVGFDLNVEFYSSNDDFGNQTFGDDDFFPMMIYGYRSGANSGLADVTMIMVSASYPVNDFVTVKGKILVAGEEGDALVNNFDGQQQLGDDDVGIEIDAHAIFKWTPNLTSTLSISTWSPGDAYGPGDDETATDIRLRNSFKF